MAIKLHQLSEQTADIVVLVGDDKLEITFRPGAFTPATNTKLQEAIRSGHDTPEVVAQLSEAITEWGLLGDDGKPLPVSADLLNQLPMAIIRQIMEAIADTLNPKKASGED